MSSAADFLAARYRLAWVYEETVREMMLAIERERDVDLLPHGMAVHAAWGALCDIDSAYRKAREKESRERDGEGSVRGSGPEDD